MPKEITVEVPTVDDIKETVSDAVEAVENDIEETAEKSRVSNLTVTQKVGLGLIVAGGVALVVRKIRRLRRTVPVVADLEGEIVTGELLVDED